MRKVIQSLNRHKFFSLSGGIVASNVLSLITMPLFSRLYPVEAFGYFAVFWSLATLLGVFVTLRFELALPLIEDLSERRRVARMSWFFSIVLILLFLLVWYGISLSVLFQSLPQDGYFGIAVAAASLLIAALQIQMQLAIKLGHLNSISWRYIVEKVVVVMATLALTRFSNYGLIAAQVAGLLASAVLLVRSNKAGAVLVPSIPHIALFKKYSDFPAKSGPSQVLQILTSQLPPLLYAMLFPVQLLGFYNLAQRLIDAPNAVVNNALSVVYYRRLLDAKKSEMRRIFTRTVRFLSVALLPPTVVVALFSEPLMTHVFGPQWSASHIFLRLLLPLAFFRMLFVAAQSLFLILRQLDQELLVSAAVFATTLAGLGLGYFTYGTLEGAVGVSSALTAMSYLGGLSMIYKNARRIEAADKG